MDYKWAGAALIILGCGGFGFSLAAAHLREEAMLRQLIGILDYMACELQFHMTPLPDLCRQAGQGSYGKLSKFFCSLAEELDMQLSSDVSISMNSVLSRLQDLPAKVMNNLHLLSSTMGRFDLDGQLSGLDQVRTNCRKDLDSLTTNRDARLRSYQTLGLCTGAAIAILFF